MLVWVMKAELLEEYKIYLEFNDGLKGVVDFWNKVSTDHRDIVRELQDKEKFSKIKVERHTLSWDNGVDFAPEYLYEQMVIQKKVA